MARGVIRIVTANMVKAIRAICVEKGYAPKEFSLLAFGGAGPLHGVGVARELEISTVIIPPNPGILCAMGLLVADARNDYVRTSLMDTASADCEEVNRIFDQLESEARQWLTSEGFNDTDQRLSRTVDMRYLGQNFELSVEVPPQRLNPGDMENLVSRFYAEHERNYGHYTPGEPTQLVNFRVIAQGVTPKLDMTRAYQDSNGPSSALLSHRSVYFDDGTPLLTPVYDRFKLRPGQRIVGPGVIEQMDSTTLLSPGDLAEIDPLWNILITLKGKTR